MSRLATPSRACRSSGTDGSNPVPSSGESRANLTSSIRPPGICDDAFAWCHSGQPAFDQGKAVVQDLANQASEIGRQAVDRAGEFVEGVAPQARQAASNLYEQGARSGAYVREYAAQEPVVAMLIAGMIGFALGYLLRGATNQSDRAG
jgi:ElaB/YqjD/DUF883 family membrane-anchored ribosome-binding protein